MNERQELFNAINRLTGHHCMEIEMDEIEHLVHAPIDEERYQELEDGLRRGLRLEISRLNERTEIAEWHEFNPTARHLRAFPPSRYRVAAPAPAHQTSVEDMRARGFSDKRYEEAVAWVQGLGGRPAISFIQRKMRISYNQAAKLMDAMEADGVVSAPNSNGVRTILKEGKGNG